MFRIARTWRKQAFVASLVVAATLSEAATFTVDSLGDFSDDDAGNGSCSTFSGNPIDGFRSRCSLRGAMEEANANPGADVIAFDVDGVIRPSSPLPVITEALTIDGSTAPGAPSVDRESTFSVDAPPPVVYVEGNATGPAVDGFVIGPGGDGSQLINLGITGFSGVAVDISHGAGIDETIVSGCWLGMTADRSAASNGAGIELAADTENVRIGYDDAGFGFSGRGNVISGNLEAAISGTATNAIIRGNWIGSDGDGDVQGSVDDPIPSIVPNGGSAIDLTGEANRISGNQVVGNGSPQLHIIGDGNVVTSNVVYGALPDSSDPDDIDSIPRGNSDGIVLSGSDLSVARNSVALNQTGIIFRSSGPGVPASGGLVQANGASFNALDGFDLQSIGAMTLEGNSAVGNGGYGVRIASDGNLLRGNRLGIRISPTEGWGNAAGGLWLGGADNRVERLGLPAEETPSVFSANAGPGITVVGDDNVISGSEFEFNQGAGALIQSAVGNVLRDNSFSYTRPGTIAPGYGALLTGATHTTELIDNVFARNQSSAIALAPAVEESNLARRNTFQWSNGPLHDLDADGATANDAGDVDVGPNRLQNFPILDNFRVDASVDPPTLTLDYHVDTNAVASDLPLTLEFYFATVGSSGAGSLHQTVGAPANPLVDYPDPPAQRTAILELPRGARGGLIRAIAVDAADNTSEFSPAIEFGERPERIFFEDFEPECERRCPIGDPLCRVCPLAR